MTFFALLTKELRLRLRRERTIWLLTAYIVLIGLLGWFTINSASNNVRYSNSALSYVGLSLYYLLSQIQLLLIIFITPAFTATVINGEKERQTFDLLLCSRLSAFSLVTGKLIAGLVNGLLLIAASIPLFSLVFFFGGVTPLQLLQALLTYIITIIILGMVGMCASAIFKRGAISTAVTYLFGLLWLMLPFLISFAIFASGNGRFWQLHPVRVRLLAIMNPLYVLFSTYGSGGRVYSSPYYGLGLYGLAGGNISSPLKLGPWNFPPLALYAIGGIVVSLSLLFLCTWLVKPGAFVLWRRKKEAPIFDEIPSDVAS